MNNVEKDSFDANENSSISKSFINEEFIERDFLFDTHVNPANNIIPVNSPSVKLPNSFFLVNETSPVKNSSEDKNHWASNGRNSSSIHQQTKRRYPWDSPIMDTKNTKNQIFSIYENNNDSVKIASRMDIIEEIQINSEIPHLENKSNSPLQQSEIQTQDIDKNISDKEYLKDKIPNEINDEVNNETVEEILNSEENADDLDSENVLRDFVDTSAVIAARCISELGKAVFAAEEASKKCSEMATRAKEDLDAKFNQESVSEIKSVRQTIFSEIAKRSLEEHLPKSEKLKSFYKVRVDPQELLIPEYDLGIKYKKSFKIHNYSNKLQRISLHPPNSKYFYLVNESSLLSTSIAPGMFKEIYVDFLAPDDLAVNRNSLNDNNMNLNNPLNLENQQQNEMAVEIVVDGFKEEILYLKMKAFPSGPRLEFNNEIDFGVLLSRFPISNLHIRDLGQGLDLSNDDILMNETKWDDAF
ncbi:hypothetical protein HK096_009215, partial [Nowakowskiella sp. JEL0078]